MQIGFGVDGWVGSWLPGSNHFRALVSSDSGLWAGSVIESPCPYVCVSVIKVVIVDNGQSISCFVFLYIIEWVHMVLRILNLEGHKNCMIS